MKPTHSLGKVTRRRKYARKQAGGGWKTVGDVFALVWAARAGGSARWAAAGRASRSSATRHAPRAPCVHARPVPRVVPRIVPRTL